jgi:hypothetical protein
MVDTNITLTATCTNPPITTYTWIGCTSTTNTCTATSPVAGVATYGVKATNAVGEGAMATVPVTWQPRPTAPPACTVTSSNATPSANTNITLTATCTNSPTSYVWSNCTSTTNTCTATSASAGLVTYGVTATNVIGAGTPATVDVTWQAAPTSYCSAYSDVKYIDIPWGSSARYYTSSVGGFPQDRVIVVSITVPSTSGSYPIQGNTAFAEWQGPPAQRVMTLSTSACDFTPGSYMAGAGGTSPFIAWNVGVPPNSLVPGRTYYFNLKNQPGACPYSSCDMSTTIQWPH